jgi:hypothetical protein
VILRSTHRCFVRLYSATHGQASKRGEANQEHFYDSGRDCGLITDGEQGLAPKTNRV